MYVRLNCGKQDAFAIDRMYRGADFVPPLLACSVCVCTTTSTNRVFRLGIEGTRYICIYVDQLILMDHTPLPCAFCAISPCRVLYHSGMLAFPSIKVGVVGEAKCEKLLVSLEYVPNVLYGIDYANWKVNPPLCGAAICNSRLCGYGRLKPWNYFTTYFTKKYERHLNQTPVNRFKHRKWLVHMAEWTWVTCMWPTGNCEIKRNNAIKVGPNIPKTPGKAT